MRVTGLDLSLTGAGWGTSTAAGLKVGRIGSTGKADFSLQQRHERLSRHASAIVAAVATDSLVVVEQPSYGSKGGSQHDRSGFWWMVIGQLIDAGHDVAEVAPTSLKLYATGSGAADKEAMLLAADRLHPSVGVRNNDEADALMLCSMGSRHLGAPLEKLNAPNLKALLKVRWP